MKAGKLYGIGVGPGDPELITLKARRILGEVDVVMAPRSSSDRKSLALDVVKDFVKADAVVLEPIFPMTSDEDIIAKHVERAVEEALSYLRKGRNLAFVTLGDPLLYSTYSRLLRQIPVDASFKVETVPGVNSISSCLAALNISLADKGERIAIIPAAQGLEDLEELSKHVDVLVFLKVSRTLDELRRRLEDLGLHKKATLFEGCGSKGFNATPLEDLGTNRVGYLSMVIVKGGGP